MSLFVGNLSNKISPGEFENAFRRYGSCKVDLKERFAFVTYEHDGDAEMALRELNGAMVSDHRVNVEWSRQSGRFNQNPSKRPSTREKSWSRGKRSPSRSYSRGRRRERESPDYR